uniref:Uncharacterized protein n=1 Tax=Siphoviridae sp. ctoSr5 TaxID=2826460 RepID=A0A8S5MUM2_9CAUD|nr:MAG TPA: hypothetical protein [Siphoviridae sp. ctoSr5]
MKYNNSIGQKRTIFNKIRHIDTIRYNSKTFSLISTRIIH